MTEAEKKKGLSKGCLIGLIVAGVLLVMVIVAAVVVWVYWEDVTKFTGNAFVTTVKTSVAENPPSGLDTVSFNATCDAFSERFSQDQFDAEKYAAFFGQIQSIPSDSKVDSVEAQMFLEAMFEYYPDLKELMPPAPLPDTASVADSLGLE